MKKNRGVQIMAFLALFGIIIGVIGTGLIIILDSSSSISNEELTEQQVNQLLEQLSASGITVSTGAISSTGEIK